MTEKEMESQQGKWFLAWWGILPTDLFTSKSKGSREEAWKEWKKLNPDRDLCAKIGQYTKDRESVWREQMRGDNKMASWKHAVRLIRYRFWDDDLPAQKRQKVSGPTSCKCGGPVDHAPAGLCWSCYEIKHPHWSDVKVTGMARV